MLSPNRTKMGSLKLLSRVSIHKPHSNTPLMSMSKLDDNDELITAICDWFRSGRNWDAVTRKFDSIDLSNSLVERVLLKLNDPSDAKSALSFFHWSAKTHRFQHSVRSYCIAINILVQVGLITDAKALLESVTQKNAETLAVRAVVDSLIEANEVVVSGSHSSVFNLLIQTYAKSRLIEVAFDVCRYVEERGFHVSLASFNALLHVAVKSDKRELVWEVYEHMVFKRVYPNSVTLRIMIEALCKVGQLQRNVDTLDQIFGKRSSPSPSTIVNFSLMSRMLEKGHLAEGEERERVVVMVVTLLKRLLQQNLIPNLVCYSLILHVKIMLGDLDSAWELYDEMVKRGFQENSFVYTSFIGRFCKDGKIEEAIGLMREMEGKNLKPYGETFDYLIVGCADTGKLDGCLSIFKKMLSGGFVPGCLPFNKIVEKLCQSGDVEKANVMLTIMLDKGFKVSDVTYSNLIKGYAKKDEFQEVLKLYYEMEYKSMGPGLSAFTSMIQCLCRCGKVEDAEKYLRVMKGRLITPNVTIYEALITGHEQKGNEARALQLRNEMAIFKVVT